MRRHPRSTYPQSRISVHGGGLEIGPEKANYRYGPRAWSVSARWHALDIQLLGYSGDGAHFSLAECKTQDNLIASPLLVFKVWKVSALCQQKLQGEGIKFYRAKTFIGVCAYVLWGSLNNGEMLIVPCDLCLLEMRLSSPVFPSCREFRKMAVGLHIWATGDLSLWNGFMQIK